MHLKFLAQYKHDTIVVPDGIGYHGSDDTTESALKRFAYPLLNKINTTITVTSKNSLYFYVKVINKENREITKITADDYHFSSPPH
jgi:hypothetical protein